MPVPSSASEKVFDQPTDVNRPTATTHHIAVLPPTKIAVINRHTTALEKINSVRPARDLPNWNNTQHKPTKGRYVLNVGQLSAMLSRHIPNTETSEPLCIASSGALLAAQSSSHASSGMTMRSNCFFAAFISLNSTAPMKRPIINPPQ